MTNSRSLSWIDRGRWNTLLAAATQGGPALAPRGPTPARPAPARPAPAAPSPARETPAPEPAAAAAAPAAPAAVATPRSYATYECTSTLLDDRLQALMAWIEASVPCQAAFIADDNGLPVVEHIGAEQGHVAAASSILLMLASVRSLVRESGGWLSLKLSSSVLNVVELTTQWGRFGIGVVTDDLLSQEFFAALSAAVERAFHGDSPEGETT
ncbi:MAG: hypothetical protein R3B48_25385 [Kofleriaceae bacterium]